MIRLHREEPNIFVEIPRIPKVTETLRDILTERWNIKWLEENDELKKGKTTLKKILLDLEELVLGNAGVDPFEEIFKLIYAKLYDEWKAINEPKYQLEFFVGGRSSPQVKNVIEKLLDGAKNQWRGVFEPTDKIELRDDHLKVCVSFLEKIKLFNSNLQIIDEAFEYLVPQVSKKKEGQFFTPRPVIDMVVKMLNPKYDEAIIDPACGSCGFTLHSILWIAGGELGVSGLPEKAKDFAQNRVFGIDFAKKAVKIAKAINLIAGDGKAHVYKANSLAPFTWDEETRAGLRERLLNFKDTQKNRENAQNFIYFDFDVLMTNPPFAGTVKERDILRLYKLAEKRGKLVNKIGRHILFLERSLQFIRPDGRMAIVLPQGLLNNTSTEYIRRFIIEEARILAVVGLHVNTFKPHTGTKTSVLFLQKYTEEEKEKIQQIRTKYEAKFDKYLNELQKTYNSCNWQTVIDEEKLAEEIRGFLDFYFSPSEEIEEIDSAVKKKEENKDDEKVSLKELIDEFKEINEVLKENKEELKKDKQKLKEVKVLEKKAKKLYREISERTIGGQIWLIFNDVKIREEFKKFWIEGQALKELDYSIFMAVNKKPVKDNSGEYRYKKLPSGEYEVDEHGHPIIDHDLNEIAEEFIKFAKEQKFNFWT